MDWLKDVLVDIMVTLFIASALWLGDVWMWWVIAVYTALMLIAKVVVLTGEGMLSRAQKSQQAPEWFLHLLYALNVVMLGYIGWWFLFTGWALIWLISYLGNGKVST